VIDKIFVPALKPSQLIAKILARLMKTVIDKIFVQHFHHSIVSGTVFGKNFWVFGVALGNDEVLFEKFHGIGVKKIVEGKVPAASEILEYLGGERKVFSVVPKPLWGTPFERRVWCELRSVKFGETITYSQLAWRCGSPRAARAVANAMAKNPIPIIIPCHRVVRADGGFGGFSAGIRLKKYLLDMEKSAYIEH